MTGDGLLSHLCRTAALYIFFYGTQTGESMVVSPYGFWNSPITSDLVVADAIRLDQVVALDGNAIYWTESQPRKQGRCFVYRAKPRLAKAT